MNFVVVFTMMHVKSVKIWIFRVSVDRLEQSFTQGGYRTHDPLLASQVMYQRSYPGSQFCLRFVPIHHSDLTVLHTPSPSSIFFDILLHQT